MEELRCTTQLPSSNTFTNCDWKYSLTFSLIKEMRQLSRTPQDSFSTLWPFLCLPSDTSQFFSTLSEMWTPETSTAPSRCAPVPNPEVTKPPYSHCLLYLAVHPGILLVFQLQPQVGSHMHLVFHHPFPEFLLPETVSSSTSLTYILCFWMLDFVFASLEMHICLLALGLASCPGCL